MAKIKVKPADIEILEIKADAAYSLLKEAIAGKKPLLIPSAVCLYEHDLGQYLSGLTEQSTKNFVHLKKGGKRASRLERYILQAILMHHTAPDAGEQYAICIAENSADNIGGLKAYIDAEDVHGPGEAEVFRLIQNKAERLREENRYDLIMNTMDYVRENYPVPKFDLPKGVHP